MKVIQSKVPYCILATLLMLLFYPYSSHAEEMETNPISVNVLYPKTGDIVGSQFDIGIGVSSMYEVTKVTAQIESVTADLEYNSDRSGYCQVYVCPDWMGVMNIDALTKGEKTLLITAWDSRGNSSSASVNIIYDEKPVIHVQQPANYAVATTKLHIQTSCTDDDPSGCAKLEMWIGEEFGSKIGDTTISAVDNIDQDISLEPYDGKQVYVWFRATDSKNQSKYEKRVVSVEFSPWLAPVDTIENSKIFEVRRDRILFYNPDMNKLGIKDRQTGQVMTIPEIPGKTPRNAYLTPHGAIFLAMGDSVLTNELFDWRDGQLISLGSINSTESLKVKGNYAIYVQDIGSNNRLVLRNLESGTNEDISTGVRIGNWKNDLTGTGKVVYWTSGESNYNIYQYENGTVTQITYDTDARNVYPLTDGTSILYLKLPVSYHDPTSSLILYGDHGEEILSTSSSGIDYQINDGWIAFTREGSGGIKQVWVRSPEGTEEQVSDLGTSSNIRYLAENGDVVFSNGNNLYLSKNSPEGSSDYIRISSFLLKPFRMDGQWFGTIDSTLFEIKEEAAAPPTTALLANRAAPLSWYNTDVNIELQAVDNDSSSGVSKTFYRTNGGEWKEYSAPFAISATGTYKVEYYSSDLAGSKETPKTVTFGIDKIAPVTKYTVTPVYGTDKPAKYIKGYTVTLTATDNLSGVKQTFYRLNNGEWTLYSAPITLPGSGDTNLEFYSEDHAGNKENNS